MLTPQSPHTHSRELEAKRRHPPTPEFAEHQPRPERAASDSPGHGLPVEREDSVLRLGPDAIAGLSVGSSMAEVREAAACLAWRRFGAVGETKQAVEQFSEHAMRRIAFARARKMNARTPLLECAPMGLGMGLSLSLGGGLPAIGPPPIVTNIQFALVSTTGISASDILAGTVGTWTDTLSGQTFSVTQATGASKPTYASTAAGYGGRPALASNGSQFLAATIAGFSQPCTTYWVGEVSSAGGVVAVGTQTGAATLVGSGFAGANLTVVSGGTSIAGAVNNSTPHVTCTVLNGASSAVYMTDSQTASGSGNAGATNVGTSLGIFASGTGGALIMVGKMVAVVVYAAAHNASQRQQIMKWLGAGFRLAVS